MDERTSKARRLRVGDRLREVDGTEAVVAGLRRNVGQAVVYTLTVAKDHTFFVGTSKVLVHNCAKASFPIPPTPGGMSTAEFGQQVMKWGRGDAEAIARASDPTLTKGYLDSKGVTLEMAEQWRDFYINEAHVRPNNPSAKGRAELMQKAVELLGGH